MYSRFSIVPADIIPQSYLLQYLQPAAVSKRQLREERFRNIQRERSGRVRGKTLLRSDSAASSGMMSPFLTGSGTQRRNEGPRSLTRSLGLTVRVFRDRHGLVRDIGSRGTDNLVLTGRWTTLVQDPGPAHLIDTDKPIILFRTCRM